MSKVYFSIIYAVSKDRLFAVGNKMPWQISQEFRYFLKITTQPYKKDCQNVVIMGKNTFLTTPKLKERIEILVSSTYTENPDSKRGSPDKVVSSLNEALDYLTTINHGKVFVIGGQKLIEEAFTHPGCEEIYETVVHMPLKKYDYYNPERRVFEIAKDSKFLKKMSDEYKIHSTRSDKMFDSVSDIFLSVDFNVYRRYITTELNYLKLMEKILIYGEERDDRTGTGTLSLFGEHLEIDILDKFPLLTTKKINFKHVVVENIWFISGAQDTKFLTDNGVKIWEGNTTREFLDNRGLYDYEVGQTGPIYGANWRNFFGVDQLNEMLNLLKTDPFSRRIYMSAWNPPMIPKGVLPPCHVSLQLYVSTDKKYIDGHLYMRSSDVFLGLSWNIAGYSLILYMFGKLANLTPRKLYISFGDCHVYLTHKEQSKLQLSRTVRPFPKLKINDNKQYKTFEDFDIDDFILENYCPHPFIAAKMAV